MKPNNITNPIQMVRGGRGEFSVITSKDYAPKAIDRKRTCNRVVAGLAGRSGRNAMEWQSDSSRLAFAKSGLMPALAFYPA
jgi:hypothetical protein